MSSRTVALFGDREVDFYFFQELPHCGLSQKFLPLTKDLCYAHSAAVSQQGIRIFIITAVGKYEVVEVKYIILRVLRSF